LPKAVEKNLVPKAGYEIMNNKSIVFKKTNIWLEKKLWVQQKEKKGTVEMVEDLNDLGYNARKISKKKSVIFWLLSMKNKRINIVKNDLTNAADWSGKVDYTDKEIVTFDLGYAQNNYLKYKEDSDVIKPVGTDKNFQLNDNTLEYEKTIVTLPYSATESVSRLGGVFIPKINSFEEYLVKKEFKPRCLLMKYDSGSFMYRKNKNNTTDSVTITINIPYCHFILDSEEFNYGFGNSLFNEFWLYIIGVIDKAKVFNVPMQLSTLDIINFDFLKAVYIAELDSHFYVSKIKFDYTSRKSSIVELIKLL